MSKDFKNRSPRFKEREKFGISSLHPDYDEFKMWLYKNSYNTFLYLSVGLMPMISEYSGPGNGDNNKFLIDEKRKWLLHFNDAFKSLEDHHFGVTNQCKGLGKDAVNDEIDNRYRIIKHARRYFPNFDYRDYKEAIDYFGLPDNVFHTGDDFLMARQKAKDNLADCTLADTNAKRQFKAYDEYLNNILIETLDNQKLEFVSKNSYKKLSIEWKEILISYFDKGNDKLKEKLYGKHLKTGLKDSKEFTSFLRRLEEKKQAKRLDRQRKKDDKEKQKANSQSQKNKRFTRSRQNNTDETDYGKLYITIIY